MRKIYKKEIGVYIWQNNPPGGGGGKWFFDKWVKKIKN